ncbi:MAG TPA: glutamate--tRNA ligase [Bacteroidia bacterium]|nr:glutamate--tRNA ligase [Bacteroidia bacterium]HNT79356.1 glutamate--tRNA ligase [Bacteroidia bacterium]
MNIRTRFAPSPTGPLHMGGVRTALYAYLFACKHQGTFILRIEDTDQTRYVPGAEEYIVQALQWAGIKIHEGVSVGGPHAPYRQSERAEIYKKYAMQLIESGHAYYAFDTVEQLDQGRKAAEQKKQTFMYGAATRMSMNNSLTLSQAQVDAKLQAAESYVIRLKVPDQGQIEFNDLIRGSLSVACNTIDDKVLLKSDGMPTYHLAHMVDDVLMEITHVIRGEEWLPSAPAHVLLYRFLGLEKNMPAFAHLPLLLKPDGNGKLSKRDGDRLGFPVFPLNWVDPSSGETSSGYREKGYSPQAFVNMLAFLGWNPGTEKEIFTMQELIDSFSFDHVHKSGARFDPDKCRWFNAQWLQQENDKDIANRLRDDFIQTYGLTQTDHKLSDAFLCKLIALVKPRVEFEQEIIQAAPYLFSAPQSFDQNVMEKKWNENKRPFFIALSRQWKDVSGVSATEAESQFKQCAADHQLKAGEVLQLLRVFISGQASGIDLFPMIELLSAKESSERIAFALTQLAEK